MAVKKVIRQTRKHAVTFEVEKDFIDGVRDLASDENMYFSAFLRELISIGKYYYDKGVRIEPQIVEPENIEIENVPFEKLAKNPRK